MTVPDDEQWQWIWPYVGATPITQGLDSEMFDRVDYPYSETFVREAIQNSLDARLDPDAPVTVNFTFHEAAIGERGGFLSGIFAFRTEAGLHLPREWTEGTVKWLVVEDFNSKGLSGSLQSRTSDFWNYWLNFGLSNKDGSGRGGRGIGRVTFLIASQVQSVLGLTRRSADHNTAACGMSVLRAQAEGKQFRSTHAYLADAEDGSIYRLHNKGEFHQRLCSAFHLTGYSRTGFESGLALVIPYPHEELKSESILAAAIENFAPAIMNGMLVINADGRMLDAESIRSIALDVSSKLNDKAIAEDVDRYLTLIKHAAGGAASAKLQVPSASKSELADIRSSSTAKALQAQVDDGETVVLQLELPLDHKTGQKTECLTAVLAKTPYGRQPIDRLFREGMSLPDVRSRNPNELDLIILVDSGYLATYLNFCEGKAHLDLLESKETKVKLEENGFSGFRVKRLIKALPAELRLLLTPDISEPDANVFDSFFSVPSDKPGKTSRQKDRPDADNRKDFDPPAPKISAFRVDTLPDGLRIRANPEYDEWPVNLSVTLAYADGSRSPSWSELDFKLDNLSIDYEGCRFDFAKNRIKALDCSRECIIEVRGFDTNRELETIIRPWKHAQTD